MLFVFFSMISLGSYAQSVTFSQLLGVYKGTLTPENAFSGAEKFEVKGLGTEGSSSGAFYVISKGLPAEETIHVGLGVSSGEGISRKELTYYTMDSIKVSSLQSQITAAQFKLESHQQLLGMRSYNYSKDSAAVWVNRDSEGSFTIKVMHK